MHQRIVINIVSALLGLVCASAPAPAQEPVTLRWKWQPGADLIYQTKVDLAQTITGAQSLRSQQTEQIRIHMRVADVDRQGVATVRISYDALRVELYLPNGRHAVFDSSMPPATAADSDKSANSGGLLESMLRPIVGAEFTLKVDDKGNVISLTGAQDAMDKSLAALQGQPNAEMLTATVRQLVNDESIKRMFETNLLAIPAGPVSVGDTWQRSVHVAVPRAGALDLTFDYQLNDVTKADDGERAQIAVSGTLTQSPDEETSPGGPTVVLEKSDLKGENVFSTSLGQMTHAEMSVTMDWRIRPTSAADSRAVAYQHIEQRTVFQLLGNTTKEPDDSGRSDADAGAETR